MHDSRQWPRLLSIVAAFFSTVCLAQDAAMKSALSPTDRQFIENTTRDYLRKNPDVLKGMFAALQHKQEKRVDNQRDESVRKLSNEPRDNSGSPTLGNQQADVTIVEFLDYRCPYCRKVEPSIQKLLRADGNLRVVHKQLPILGRASVFAARMALVAQKLGRHADFHNALMSRTGQVEEKEIVEVAQAINLDFDQVRKLIDSEEITTALKNDVAMAKALDLKSTPGFLIGDEIIRGAPEFGDLAEIITEQRTSRR